MRRIAKLFLLVALPACVILLALAALFVHNPRYRSLVDVGARQTIVIKNARLFTATSTRTIEGQQVVIADGHILRIEPNGVEPPPGALSIDGSGRTLLPGLIDFHTHIVNSPAPPWYLTLPNPSHNLAAYLYAGITTVASMADDIDEIGKIRSRLEQRRIPGPRLLYAGLPITKTGGHPEATLDALVPWPFRSFLPPFAAQIDTPAEAEAAVERMAKGGASYIKMMVDDLPPGVPKLARDQIIAIVQAAHGRHLKVATHIGKAEDALLAAQNGADVLVHGVHRGPLSDEQAQALKATGVAVCPTLIVFERCAQIAEANMPFDALDHEIERREVLAQFSSEMLRAHQDNAFMRPWFEQVLASRLQQRENALTLYRAGVPIFVGTDSSILGNIAGASIHHEMALLVKAGIPPAEVLLGATARPAAFLFETPEIGTIEPGKIADLLLVDGDPVADISATGHIAALIQDGRVVQRHVP